MSLFGNEEICIGCEYAIFHDCCGKFCKCNINAEPDAIHGKCKLKKKKQEYIHPCVDCIGGSAEHCCECTALGFKYMKKYKRPKGT